jgi:peptidoglycan hydrolase-like protein with peptidoglycan-binding domain
MRARRVVALVTAGVVVIGGVAVAVAANGNDSGASTPKAKQTTTLVAVAPRDLKTTQDVTGTVGFGTAVPVRIGGGSSSASTSASATSGTGKTASASATSTGSGTITRLPAVGTVVPLGASLAEIDGAPSAFLMAGSRPMWRTLQAGISDGPDVEQLETSLALLGYGRLFTVDQTFTSGTAAAIKAFQADRGVTQTGVLTSTDIVFLSAPARVASQVASVGGSASGEILTVTGTTPLVHVDLDSSLIADGSVGAPVTIDLPDSTTVDGTILSIGAPTQTTSSASGAGGNGSGSSQTATTAPMDITTKAGIAKFDGANVVVHLVTAEAKQALSVPVKSLLALAEGGYAVERVRNGTHQLIRVTPGTFAGGFVQVTGDVQSGDQVVTP